MLKAQALKINTYTKELPKAKYKTAKDQDLQEDQKLTKKADKVLKQKWQVTKEIFADNKLETAPGATITFDPKIQFEEPMKKHAQDINNLEKLAHQHQKGRRRQ